jgi:pyrophosphatase PpaX
VSTEQEPTTAASNETNGPIEVVLFDLDGTLIDTIELILSSLRHATAEVLGEAPADDVLLHNVGVPLRVQMAEFAPDRVDELLLAYRAHNDQVHDELVCEYEGTEEALRALASRGYRMGIVTSKSVAVAHRGLDRFGLGSFFETLVGYEDTDIHKPNPEPVLLAAHRMGVHISRCCYVGDSPHDINAGRAAGATTVAALWGPFRERVTEAGPDFVIEQLTELPGILDELADRS